MTTENLDQPTGYQEDPTLNPQTGTGGRAVEKPKGKSKAPLLIFGVVFVALAGAAGYMMFAPGAAPPKPAPTPVAQPAQPEPAVDPAVDPLAADPTAVDPLAPGQPEPVVAQPSQDPSQQVQQPLQTDPLTGLPVAQPAQQPVAQIDPATGLPVAQPTQQQPAPQQAGQIDPMTGLPMAQPAQQPVAQIDPATGLPVGQAPAPAQAPVVVAPEMPAAQDPNADPFADLAAQQPQQPVVQQPVEQPVAQQPVVEQPVVEQPVVEQPVVEQPVVEQPVVNDPLAQFRDMLSPIDGRVGTLERKVGRLEGAVSRIERDLKNRPSVSSTPRPAASSPRSQSTNTVRIGPAAAPSHSGHDQGLAPVSRVTIQNGEVVGVQNSSYSAPAPDRAVAQAESEPTRWTNMDTCRVQAIVQGRVWVKNEDGTFASYGEGDRWSNGSVIEAIDPNQGVRVKGQWMCM